MNIQEYIDYRLECMESGEEFPFRTDAICVICLEQDSDIPESMEYVLDIPSDIRGEKAVPTVIFRPYETAFSTDWSFLEGMSIHIECKSRHEPATSNAFDIYEQACEYADFASLDCPGMLMRKKKGCEPESFNYGNAAD